MIADPNVLAEVVAARALKAWDAAVAAYRAPLATGYADSLLTLDEAWRAAGLPIPWYPSMVARGDLEANRQRLAAVPVPAGVAP